MKEIAKAYVQIIPTTKNIRDNISKELGGAGEAAGEKAGSGFASKMGGAIAKGTAAVGAAAAAGLAAISKQAVSSYADYEQLVGGVDTLFKDSSELVQEYAANAFKTTGLSANEYMENVTSFSASLLQSVSGDTQRAAKIADMAMTDMSDNANKMGTDMQSIQNAYQGFAKQNYTMLDNLKLGYGGTKSEMERLLKDATELTGVKYDINNLSDVYEAIHAIQGEIGITGTTALEASTTISGSANQMTAAWSNMLTGIADDNADFDSLISNLTESVSTFASNILPRIQTALGGVGQLISALTPVLINALPTLFEGILPGLLSGTLGVISALAAALPEMLSTAVTTIVTFIAENAPALMETGILLVTSLASGIASDLPALIPVAVEAILALVDTLVNNVDLLVDTGIELLTGLITGIINALPLLLEKAPEIITKLSEAFARNYPKILDTGFELLKQIITGIIKAIPELIKAVPQIITALANGFRAVFDKIKSIGANIVDGVWQGIKNAAETFTTKVRNFFKGIVDKVKNALGIHSPSTVFRDEVGAMMAAGISVGFANEMSNVRREVASEVNGIASSVGNINAGFSASVSASPSIGGDGAATLIALRRLIAAIENKETSVKVYLDSREIKAGQDRLARAAG